MALSRQHLALMGIDLYVQRGAICIKSNTVDAVLWRDMAPNCSGNGSLSTQAPKPLPINPIHDHNLHRDSTPVTVLKTHSANTLATTPLAAAVFVTSSNTADATSSASAFHAATATCLSNETILPSSDANLATAVVQNMTMASARIEAAATERSFRSDVDAFLESTSQHYNWHLELLLLQHLTLVVNAAQLQPAERDLWQNIQRHLQGEFAQFTWPSVFQACNDSRARDHYVAGFFALHTAERHVVVLGRLDPDFTLPIAFDRLSSLTEMLQNPLLKKDLWRMIREYNILPRQIG